MKVGLYLSVILLSWLCNTNVVGDPSRGQAEFKLMNPEDPWWYFYGIKPFTLGVLYILCWGCVLYSALDNELLRYSVLAVPLFYLVYNFMLSTPSVFATNMKSWVEKEVIPGEANINLPLPAFTGWWVTDSGDKIGFDGVVSEFERDGSTLAVRLNGTDRTTAGSSGNTWTGFGYVGRGKNSLAMAFERPTFLTESTARVVARWETGHTHSYVTLTGEWFTKSYSGSFLIRFGYVVPDFEKNSESKIEQEYEQWLHKDY